MAKFTIFFDVRKGNNVASPSTTVECDSEYMAVQLAENKLKASHPSWRDYTWSPKQIKKS